MESGTGGWGQSRRDDQSYRGGRGTMTEFSVVHFMRAHSWGRREREERDKGRREQGSKEEPLLRPTQHLSLLSFLREISFQQPPILKAITSRRSCSYPWLQDAPTQGHQEAAECGCQFWSQMVWTKIPAFSPTSGTTLTK